MHAGPQLLRDWIARAAEQEAEKPWIVAADDGRAVTYRELHRFIGRLAAFLRDRGIGANQRVALLANNSIEHLACYVGVMAYGATISTIEVEMNRHHLDHILSALGPRLIVFDETLGLDDLLSTASAPSLALGHWGDRGECDSLYAAVDRCEPTAAVAAAAATHDAVIFFTSGTTARPKGVVMTFRELLANVGPLASGFGVRRDDRIYDFRSFNWCSAQVLSALAPLCRGATLILAQHFSRSRFFEHIKCYGATIATGNPTTIGMLLGGDNLAPAAEVPALRFITSSSAPLLVGEWRRFEESCGIRVTQGYGCSEVGWIAAAPGEIRRLGTVGKPFAYHRLRVVDGGGQTLKAEEVGSLEVGAFDDTCYRALAQDGTIRVHSRGRLKTGDLGFLDSDGYLHLTGREKELIIRGGVNISPLEIDNLLMLRPEIGEAATVGVPHAIYGEEVVSYVVARPGVRIDRHELLRYCNKVLPPFKAPKEIIVSASLPKNERGKLDRKALTTQWSREREGDHGSDEAP
jgi:acyl-coenzyme A synthetase/AMP-(fatty) acid ligase